MEETIQKKYEWITEHIKEFETKNKKDVSEQVIQIVKDKLKQYESVYQTFCSFGNLEMLEESLKSKVSLDQLMIMQDQKANQTDF